MLTELVRIRNKNNTLLNNNFTTYISCAEQEFLIVFEEYVVNGYACPTVYYH